MKMIQFRVPDEDAALLKEAAWLKKMSLAEWLRKVTLATARAQRSGSPPK